MVKKIEEVSGELKLDTLRDVGGFAQAHVEVPEAETGQGAASSIIGAGRQQSRSEILDRGSRI